MYLFYINNVLLPVTPSKLSVKIKNQNNTVNLVDGSEYNVLKLPGLSEYSFDCLLPRYGYPFAQYGAVANSKISMLFAAAFSIRAIFVRFFLFLSAINKA